MRWTGLVGQGLALKVARRARLLADEEHWRRASHEIQGRALRGLLEAGAPTRFGRAHGFDRLLKEGTGEELLAGYRAAVPIRDWHGIAGDVREMREEGRTDVLWPGLVRHFAQTSGTTAGDKFIPVTRAMFRSNKRASYDIFAYLKSRGLSLPRITEGRCLFLGGSSDLKANRHGIITADLSGLVTPLIRWPLSEVYSPGPRVALISDWPEKIDAMARITIEQDIRFISGMPSWAHVLMRRVLELAGERGRPRETIRDLWPNLAAFVHGGVRYDPFRARIGRLVSGSDEGDFPHRHELYPASEAFIAMQDREREPGLRLLVDGGNFFEFVPIEEADDEGNVPPDAPAVTASGAEPGRRYCVVLTTCAGLWRYSIGDVVEFEDVPAGPGSVGTGPPRLRIVGRNRHFINAFGENLIVEHIETAAFEAGAAARSVEPRLDLGEFTAAPVYPETAGSAGLELVIEAGGASGRGASSGGGPGLAGEALARFAAVFDEVLKRQNVDYTTKRRDDLGMSTPIITAVPIGTFHRWMASRGKLGGQNKCPRCANHRDFVDAVRREAGVDSGGPGADAAARGPNDPGKSVGGDVGVMTGPGRGTPSADGFGGATA